MYYHSINIKKMKQSTVFLSILSTNWMPQIQLNNLLKKILFCLKCIYKAAFLWPSGCLINMLFNTSLILYANFLHQCKTTSHTVKNQPKRKKNPSSPYSQTQKRMWCNNSLLQKLILRKKREVSDQRKPNRADVSTLLITEHLTCPPMPLYNLHSQQNREMWLPTERLKSFENNSRPWGQLEVAAQWGGPVLNWLQNRTRGWTQRWYFAAPASHTITHCSIFMAFGEALSHITTSTCKPKTVSP